MLVNSIYSIVKSNLCLKKDYSLTDQIKRASVSVATNISEGYLRSRKQTSYYLHIAAGSANEVITLLEICSLVYKIDTLSLQNKYEVLAKQITAFSKSLFNT